MADREGALGAPFPPPPNRLGRPRTTDWREVMTALLSRATTGRHWAQLPQDFPPCSPVRRYFPAWRDSGLLQTARFALAREAREREGREASPGAGAIDGQSVKTPESGGVRGFGPGKRTRGRKRHSLVDTLGLMVGLVVHAADVPDRAARRRSRSPSVMPAPGFGGLRGRRIGWTQTAGRARQDGRRDLADRQTLRCCEGLRGPAATVGGGAPLRLAWALPEAGGGLREIHRCRRGLDQRRPHPPHTQTNRKALVCHVEFRVRL